MCNIWTSITDVTIHLPHYADVFVAVKQREFLISARHSRSARISMRCLVSLETRVRQNDNESLGVLVVGRNWDMLFGSELW
jgi:hypothetical protein